MQRVQRERVDFNTHGTFMPTHRVGRRRVGWYTTANASHIIAHGWMDGWMDAARFPRMDGCAQTHHDHRGVPPGRTRRFNDDLNAGNETNGNSRARCDGVRPPTSVASTRIAGVETVAEKALWMSCRKKIYSRVQRLTSDATTKRSIERTQGDYREFLRVWRRRDERRASWLQRCERDIIGISRMDCRAWRETSLYRFYGL